MVEPTKIETVREWDIPKTLTVIRSLLGSVSYYRRFFQDFSKIALPLTKITRKEVKYECGPNQEEAFKELKEKLTQAPVLALPEGNEDLVVYSDASEHRLRCVLVHCGRVIAYPSRQLKVHDVSYPTHDSELAAVKELNMRQMRWLGILKDYDCEIIYHPGKADVVAHALRRKDMPTPIRVKACQLVVTPDVMTDIEKVQTEALKDGNIKKERMVGQHDKLKYTTLGVRTRFGWVWIPMAGELRTKILDEAHKSRYSIHPGATKMYQDQKKEYRWPGMKNDVTKYVSKCLTCSQLPRTTKGHDTIWAIIDRLTKSAHFLPIREMFSSERLAKVFIIEVVAQHGVPLSIVSDRDTRFTLMFQKSFHEAMGARLNIFTAYHPQADGLSESTIQMLEEMLRSSIIDFGDSLDRHLPLVEFSYNNSYHSTIGMPSYEMLYERRCRTSDCWGEIGQKELGSLELLTSMMPLDSLSYRMKWLEEEAEGVVRVIPDDAVGH
ncbi:hypothetical protein L1987_06411 [Smallanthus sonchifolius]|uniref:Uncharacterized protein n=1 Tax=Smallanthus sonchifolius TaxID=185202 RepID=A0ACB9JY37_9ASTR|nr:hypothetical protein L1987_06411 [Smallanthus sonchifolius]